VVVRSVSPCHARAIGERGGPRRSVTDETVPPVTAEFGSKAVSYTHLDVYKRQIQQRANHPESGIELR